jgi:alpha-glucosidase
MSKLAPIVRALFGAAVFLGAASAATVALAITVSSPDGFVKFEVNVGEQALVYSIDFHDKPVIERSAIVILIDGVTLTDGLELVEAKRSSIDETYAYRGVHSQAINRCNTAQITLRQKAGGVRFTLEARVFNNGVGFRYVIPGNEAQSRVPDEQTMFKLPAYSTVWSHNLTGHYEATHKRQELAEVTDMQWCAPPMTFKLPGGAGYASITEAALVNYPGMALQANGRGGFQLVLGDKHPIAHPFELRYKDDIPRVSTPAAITGAITSPWRVVMVGADLNALVNCDIVPDLCPPPDPKLFPRGIATDWCKPGRAVWRYLDGGESNYNGVMEFSRLAGELGFEYQVVEGLWRRWTDQQVKELVDYSKQRGVGILGWVSSKDVRDPQVRHDLLKRCHDLGMVGLKIDFFDHEAKELIDLYQTLLKEGAENQLLMVFHGANKPTGEPRTWPNEMTREAIRGMESRNVPSRAVHETTLPFTRFLAGHADYTPVLFGDRRGDTTWAHQAAIAAVFTSPLLTYGCNPKTMLDNPCGPMLKSIPPVWDETIVLPDSEIGELAAFARRNGNTWFLAVVNGPTPRTLKATLSFLADGPYQAALIRDQPDNPEAVQIENTTAKRGDVLTIDMSHGGGFIGRFSRN